MSEVVAVEDDLQRESTSASLIGPRLKTSSHKLVNPDGVRVRAIVEACFSTKKIEPDPVKKTLEKRSWSCKFCTSFADKSFAKCAIQRPLHHIMGCSESGGSGQASPCKGSNLPLDARNKLRELYRLPIFVVLPTSSASTSKTSARQMSLSQATDSANKEAMNKELAMVFYECNLPFALMDHHRMRHFLEMLARSNILGFSPLTARQVSAEARILAAEEDSNRPNANS